MKKINVMRLLVAGVFFSFSAVFFAAATSDVEEFETPDGPVGDMAAGMAQVKKAISGGQFYYDRPLNFLKQEVTKDEKATYANIPDDWYQVPRPSSQARARRARGVAPQLDLAKAYDALNNLNTPVADSVVADLKQLLGFENRDDLMEHLFSLTATQTLYDSQIKKLSKYGMSRRESIALFNGFFLEEIKKKEIPDLNLKSPGIRAQQRAKQNPTSKNKFVSWFYSKVLAPVMRVRNRNIDIIDAVAKTLVIVSAVAFIANKFGFTEWLRNKIRESFNRPSVWTLERRKAGIFGRKQEKLLKEEDLILAPSTRIQVSELIFLVNRRQEMKKISKRKPTFPSVLLMGPPGTGKTSIARMIADRTIGDDGKPMKIIMLMATDFMRIKAEADRLAVLKEMFEMAEKEGNCIIFLDEFDGMVQQRGKDSGEDRNRAFLDYLLAKMGKPSSRYMLIAATNHSDRIDKALMDRFRRKIQVDLPTEQMRILILDKYIRDLLLTFGYTSSINILRVASLMKSASGREIEIFITRLRDRLDFSGKNEATQDIAEAILREMGITVPLAADDTIDVEKAVPHGSND